MLFVLLAATTTCVALPLHPVVDGAGRLASGSEIRGTLVVAAGVIVALLDVEVLPVTAMLEAVTEAELVAMMAVELFESTTRPQLSEILALGERLTALAAVGLRISRHAAFVAAAMPATARALTVAEDQPKSPMTKVLAVC